jgi:hypothetical protein
MNTLAGMPTADPSLGSWEFKQKAPAALSNTGLENIKPTCLYGTNGASGNKEESTWNIHQ